MGYDEKIMCRFCHRRGECITIRRVDHEGIGPYDLPCVVCPQHAQDLREIFGDKVKEKWFSREITSEELQEMITAFIREENERDAIANFLIP